MFKITSQIVALCVTAFENFVGKHNPCDDLTNDIASCIDNMKYFTAGTDKAEIGCNQIALNAISDVNDFECSIEIFGKKTCIDLENLNESIKSAAETYKTDRNDTKYNDTVTISTMDCIGENALNTIPCKESAKLSGKFGKASADIATPQKTYCSCCCFRK